ncbi:hypothetical protein FF38_10775 [Lucilia cuprina]|uniref:Uncharacterized protein n=1 Tax=Lucilia cuprina TaxID=7375 RepID=A0A0L0C4A5_LUCCU|nr:hypothetical protein FF38_10775 [Lucilia cuprina]
MVAYLSQEFFIVHTTFSVKNTMSTGHELLCKKEHTQGQRKRSTFPVNVSIRKITNIRYRCKAFPQQSVICTATTQSSMTNNQGLSTHSIPTLHVSQQHSLIFPQDPQYYKHTGHVPERPDSQSAKDCQLSKSCIDRKFFPQGGISRRLAGEQATAASASEVGSSGFLRLIKCEISLGFDEDVIMAADVAAVPSAVNEEATAAAVADAAVADFEEPASTSPLLSGLM